jgi:hypothetical protein
MKINTTIVVLVIIAVFIGCSAPPPLKYGFLPAKEYPFYPFSDSIHLKQKKICFIIEDRRNEFQKLSCSDVDVERDSEVEGKNGVDYLSAYLSFLATDHSSAMRPLQKDMITILPLQAVESSSVAVSQTMDTVKIELEVLSPKLLGFIFVKVHGLVQYTAKCRYFTKRYCSDLKDGDPDSPVGSFSLDTRRDAMRKIMSASVLRVTSAFIQDYSKY